MSRQFGELIASELYCPRCARSQPVRQRLLLILPDGELNEYCCRQCGNVLGQRRVSGSSRIRPDAGPASLPGPLPSSRRCR